MPPEYQTISIKIIRGHHAICIMAASFSMQMTNPIRIAVIGSSTAAGHGAEPLEKSWVNLYEAYLKTLHPENSIVNLGLGGQQTFHLLPTGHKPPPARPLPDPERNITRALAFAPDAVIVNAPSNDAAALYGPEEQLHNFDIIDRTAQLAGVPVWVCTTQPRIFSEKQIEIQVRLKDAILTHFGQFALNFWDGLATPENLPDPRFDLGDGTHLNNAGHARIFEIVKKQDLPAAIIFYKKQQQQTQLPGGKTLEIPFLTEGEVVVEIYNEQAELRFSGTGTLPMKIQEHLGPQGIYWVRIAGSNFNRMFKWLKTA